MKVLKEITVLIIFLTLLVISQVVVNCSQDADFDQDCIEGYIP